VQTCVALGVTRFPILWRSLPHGGLRVLFDRAPAIKTSGGCCPDAMVLRRDQAAVGFGSLHAIHIDDVTAECLRFLERGKQLGMASRQPNIFGMPLGVRNFNFAAKTASDNEVRMSPSPRPPDKPRAAKLRGFLFFCHGLFCCIDSSMECVRWLS